MELGNSSGGSTISQTFGTETGQQYQVVFALSGDWNSGENTKNLRVAAGNDSADFSITEPNGWAQSNNLWEHRSFTFIANNPTTTLSFQSLESAFAQYGPVIADVQILEVPQSISTLLANDDTLSYDAASQKFYRTVNDVTDWSTAQDTALESELNGISGQLFTINSAYQNLLVFEQAIALNQNIWLGASDTTVEGDWRWQHNSAEGDLFWRGNQSGTAVNGEYNNWLATEPDNAGGLENFALLRSADGRWMDGNGTSTAAYIIEWDAREVLSNHTFDITSQSGNDAPLFAVESSSGQVRLALPTEPDGFNNHVAWFDASDSATMTNGVSGISNVADKSGTANDARNTATGPVLIASALNGLDALQFNGVNERFFLSDSSTINQSAANAKTVTMVFNAGSDISSRQTVFEQGGVTAGMNVYIEAGVLYAGVWSESNGFDGNWISTAIDVNELSLIHI